MTATSALALTLALSLGAAASATTKHPPIHRKGASGGSAAPIPADARANPFIQGNQSPPLPAGPSGKVDVIASGSLAQLIQPEGPSSLVIPVVVRNNTTKAQSGIQLTAVARNSGELVGTGTSESNLMPLVVKPGQIAIGYVYFESLPPTTSVISYSVTTGNSTLGQVELTVTDSNTSPEAGGFLNLIGQVRNQTKSKIASPGSVFGICFDSTGQPTGTLQTYTDGNSLPPGTVEPFCDQVSGDNTPCVSWLVASNGSTL